MRFIEDAMVHRTTAGVRPGKITVDAVRGILEPAPLSNVIITFNEKMKGTGKLPQFSINAQVAEGLAEYLLLSLDNEAIIRVMKRLEEPLTMRGIYL